MKGGGWAWVGTLAMVGAVGGGSGGSEGKGRG